MVESITEQDLVLRCLNWDASSNHRQSRGSAKNFRCEWWHLRCPKLNLGGCCNIHVCASTGNVGNSDSFWLSRVRQLFTCPSSSNEERTGDSKYANINPSTPT